MDINTHTFSARVRTLLPGLLISITLSMAAMFVSNAYGGPTILFALLLGMAFNFLADDARFKEGLAVGSRSILRLGVALLGARITADQIMHLGPQTLVGITLAVVATILFGMAAAKMLGLPRSLGVLTAGAVAICGASAASAIAAVQPRHENHERDTAFTIIGVTTLSTICMVLYPLLGKTLQLDHIESGIFLGGTIHDVAQVVGAALSISQETGETATIVKLLRVALLLPTVLIISLFNPRGSVEPGAKRPPLIPGFLLGFIVLVALNSFHIVPQAVDAFLSDASRWCIITAIAALGVKTSLAALAKVGPRPILLMVLQTAFLAALVLGALILTR